MAVLELEAVTKIYSKSKKNRGGALTALDSVTFSVDEGEVVGFIGPNGAGKSTAIKCITGLAAQTSGKITVCGFDTVKERAKAVANIGAIIENPDMYLEWSGEENLRYLAKLGIDKSQIQGITTYKEYVEGRIEDVLKLVGLYERRKDKVMKYSLGMKQRLGIAQALLSRPKLLILDEPANGLDPQGIRDMRDIILKLAHEMKMAVLVSSHALAEMQLLCDRFVIIKKGAIAASFVAGELNGKDGAGLIIITVDDVIKARDIIKEKFDLTAKIVGSGKLEVETDRRGDIAKELILGGVNVEGMTEKEITLEEAFMKITSNSAEKTAEKTAESESVKTEENTDVEADDNMEKSDLTDGGTETDGGAEEEE